MSMRPAGASFLVVACFVLARPLLDAFESDRVHAAGFSINAAGLLALALTAYTAAALARARSVDAGLARVWGVVLVASLLAAANTFRLVPPARHDAAVELVRVLGVAAVYLLAAEVGRRSSATALWIVRAAAVSAVVPALVGIFQLVHGVPTATDLVEGRIYGTFSGPNPFGEYLAVSAIFLIAVRDQVLRWQVRAVLLVPVLVALEATYSRTAWGLFLIALAGILARRNPRALAAIAVALAIAAFAIPGIHARITGQDRATAGSSSAVPESYRWRIDNWRYLAEAYRKQPLTGWGLATAPVVNPRRAPGTTSGYAPHNTAVKLLVEGGPLLLAAWIALFQRVFTLLRRRTPDGGAFDDAVTATRWVLLAVAVCALTSDDMLASTALLYLLFAVAGALERPVERATTG